MHSQSLMSDVSDGMNMDSSAAKHLVLEVEALFRFRFDLLSLVGCFITLDLVVTGVRDSVCRPVLGPGFRVCCGFDLFVFLGPTCKSMLEKEGKRGKKREKESVSDSWAPSRIGNVVSPSIGSLRLSMSKFSFAIIAKWNWSIQLFHWVGGSTVWFGQKAGIPRRFESVVDCAIIKS